MVKWLSKSWKMKSRKRFRETMHYGVPDRVPYFEEGIREGVLEAWRLQGLPPDSDLSDMFPYDQREEIVPDLEPRPKLKRWPTSRADLDMMRKSLDPHDPGRLAKDWASLVHAWQTQDNVRMLRIHRGFFLTMGVSGSRRFTEVMYLLKDDRDFVREAMMSPLSTISFIVVCWRR